MDCSAWLYAWTIRLSLSPLLPPQVRCPGEPSPVSWSEEFYCMLQNTVGGGKPKMRWYFARNGWPASSVLSGYKPRSEQEQTAIIDALQDYKTEQYKALIA